MLHHLENFLKIISFSLVFIFILTACFSKQETDALKQCDKDVLEIHDRVQIGMTYTEIVEMVKKYHENNLTLLIFLDKYQNKKCIIIGGIPYVDYGYNVSLIFKDDRLCLSQISITDSPCEWESDFPESKVSEDCKCHDCWGGERTELFGAE